MLRIVLISACVFVSCTAIALAGSDSDAVRKFGLYGAGWAYQGKCAQFQFFFAEDSSGAPETYGKQPSGQIQDRERISNVRAMPGDRLAFETSGGRNRMYVVYEKVGSLLRVVESKDLKSGQMLTQNGRMTWGGRSPSPWFERCS